MIYMVGFIYAGQNISPAQFSVVQEMNRTREGVRLLKKQDTGELIVRIWDKSIAMKAVISQDGSYELRI